MYGADSSIFVGLLYSVAVGIGYLHSYGAIVQHLIERKEMIKNKKWLADRYYPLIDGQSTTDRWVR
jgi:hypothetical protein